MRNNNFDMIRLIAATMVVFSHSYGINGLKEPLLDITYGQFTLGYLGVLIFFSVSGFLIFDSYLRRKDLMLFCRARILRIIPALVVLILSCTFLIGPLVTELSLKEYFKDKMTMDFLFNMFPNEFMYYLPEVFYGQPVIPHLWSIKYEIICYIWVVIFVIFNIIERKKFLVAILCFAMIYILYSAIKFKAVGQLERYAIVAFLSSGIFRLYWEKIPQSLYLVIISFLGLALSNYFKVLILGWIIFGIYIILYFAYYKKLETWKITRFGDISYGIYLWGMVLQQCIIVWIGEWINPHIHFAISMIVTVPVAYISWKLIEEPALKFK